MFSNLKLSTKLLVSFLIVGIVPFAVVSVVSLLKSRDALGMQSYNALIAVRDIKRDQIQKFFTEREGDMGVLMETVAALEEEAFKKLEAVQELKKHELEDYFVTLTSQMHVFKDDPWSQEALIEFNEAFEEGGDKVRTRAWNALAEEYGPRLKDINDDNGWYDLFLIHTDGDIVYTVAQESDLGMIIPDSELRNSSLGKALALAQTAGPDDIVIADFESYAPSNGAQAAFMMAQMRNDEGTLLGYAAFQIPDDKTSAIASLRHGMGDTGESYIVGRWDGKSAFRSTPQIVGGGRYEIGDSWSTSYTEQALAGREAQEIHTDESGDLILVCSDALDIDGLNWALCSQMRLEEAIAPRLEGAHDDYFTKYIEQYGYYDLFLIHPNGEVFYTVDH